MNKFYALVISLFLVGCKEAQHEYNVVKDKSDARFIAEHGHESDGGKACLVSLAQYGGEFSGGPGALWYENFSAIDGGWKGWYERKTSAGVEHIVCYYEHKTNTTKLALE